ncbi:hypothetical protein N5I87_15630 [Ralstonia sp. CHL-2022]|uniref:Uncharacterized protein n=1 Tax=Ralstonia mojiangensis TaxID=2953895 RepID=A0AAE3I677_9RALS|nr:hypothetical protein [Ralstonia mojiangensis]MCT7317437.1 hypothetical protein [Ralstonia mojiangensis]
MKMRKQVVLLAIGLIVAGFVVVVMKPRLLSKPVQHLLFADWMVEEERRTGPAIGQLGGVPVSIPRDYAHFLEYDGDPGFMEQRKGARPERTFASSIRAFGFEVHYPDMRVPSSNTVEERRNSGIYTSMWLRVGVSSGQDYGSDGKNAPGVYVRGMKDGFKKYKYERTGVNEYGLETYVPINVDEAARQKGRGAADFADYNVYYHTDATGRVDTYIECHNDSHEAAPCKQKFNMFPEMAAHISVSYRRGLLKDWREIQSSVSKVILGFEANTKN